MTDVAHPEFAIITGLSGAGRRTAAHTMEDLGWFTVDNLPPVMLPSLAETLKRDGVARVAVVADVRSREQFEQLPEALQELRASFLMYATVHSVSDNRARICSVDNGVNLHVCNIISHNFKWHRATSCENL